jgi:hypothetical protein
MTAYQPKTDARCSCKLGQQRDNCPNCEGTGYVIDFQAIRDRQNEKNHRRHECWACGINWVAPVEYGETTNLSGEKSVYCPKCGKRSDTASPHLEPVNISGNYRTPDGRAQIDFEIREEKPGEPVFSASGQFDGSFGQCLEEIAKAYPNDARVQEIVKVWRVWHLNDMNAGCQHQRAENWGKKELTLVKVEINAWMIPDAWQGEKRELEQISKHGWASVRTLAGETALEVLAAAKCGEVFKAEGNAKQYLSPIHYGRAIIEIQTEKKGAGWVYPKEHSEGVLCKPCPVCGYEYGSAWLYEPLPAEIVDKVKSWTQAPPLEPLHEYKAAQFLKRNKIGLRITRADSKPAPWQPAGHHYRCTLSKKGKRITFDFWGSVADAEKNQDPTSYDVLYCVSSDTHTPENFVDFCSEYGYDADSIKTRQTWKRADNFARRLRGFFTDEEQEELNEIQ